MRSSSWALVGRSFESRIESLHTSRLNRAPERRRVRKAGGSRRSLPTAAISLDRQGARRTTHRRNRYSRPLMNWPNTNKNKLLLTARNCNRWRSVNKRARFGPEKGSRARCENGSVSNRIEMEIILIFVISIYRAGRFSAAPSVEERGIT